ncbi:hypothetical protein BC828DRAFT_378331 [Blastocladiella britannica]|nr:hypothetical protein BC828DRAFT_378331 [Blastocladiella britannica]
MSYNSAEHDTIGTSPYYANFGYHPRFTTEPALAHAVENAEQLAQRLANIKEIFTKKLESAKLVMKDNADMKWYPATDFTSPNATAREVAEEFHAKYPDKPKPGDTPLPAAVPRRRRR